MVQLVKEFFGATHDGVNIYKYIMCNENGMRVSIITYGGAIAQLYLPDRTGVLADVVLGFDRIEQYEKNTVYVGAIIGRCANRIEEGLLTLNGVKRKLDCNSAKHHLHGGRVGFDKKVWAATIVNHALALRYVSPHGEEGYDGNLETTVTYRLTDENELCIDYTAVSDMDTVANFTNHSYFNLSGKHDRPVLDHTLRLEADAFTENSSEGLPTGAILPVTGTPLDFRQPKEIGRDIAQDCPQLKNCKGYDHNFIINHFDGSLRLAAELAHPESGRMLKAFTTMPGVQLYTGNFLSESTIGKDNIPFQKHSGVCLETQFFPNALKHTHFPSPILKAGQLYHHKTIYQFLQIPSA